MKWSLFHCGYQASFFSLRSFLTAVLHLGLTPKLLLAPALFTVLIEGPSSNFNYWSNKQFGAMKGSVSAFVSQPPPSTFGLRLGQVEVSGVSLEAGLSAHLYLFTRQDKLFQLSAFEVFLYRWVYCDCQRDNLRAWKRRVKSLLTHLAPAGPSLL